MKGKLIVIEGLDGSGKATQTALLFEALKQLKSDVQMLSFPCYDDASSALVRMYLGGEFGERSDDVNSFAASVFFAVDRYASFRKHWHAAYESGAVFLCDRYTTSNAVYQTAKMPREQWDDYTHWLFDFEYTKMGIPQPDVVIYLDVAPEISRKLMEARYVGDESRKDIHERDTEFQRRSRTAALYCAEKMGWHIVQCDRDGEMRTREEIASDILLITRKALK